MVLEEIEGSVGWGGVKDGWVGGGGEGEGALDEEGTELVVEAGEEEDGGDAEHGGEGEKGREVEEDGPEEGVPAVGLDEVTKKEEGMRC